MGAATGHPEAAHPLLVDFLVMEYLEGEAVAQRLPGIWFNKEDVRWPASSV